MAIEPHAAERVSTLELFFDLVFVFTITQLTAVLAADPTAASLGRVALMLGIIWWMYGGYVWLTNAVVADRLSRRFVLLGGMAAYLVLALAIPRAFGADGLAFGLAYLAIVAVHAGLFARASHRGIAAVAPFNFASAGLLVAGGAIGGTAQTVLWIAAFALLWSSPFLARVERVFYIAPAHFVERHGLVVIVAIGESVVAVGIGAAGEPLDLGLVAVALLGLALSAGLWWAYFGGDDQRAEAALAATEPADRASVALRAFGVWHLPLLLGVICVAFGLKKATAHPGDELAALAAIGLAGGTALFFGGDVGFRGALGLGRSVPRTVLPALALATIPLGTALSAAAQLAVLVALVGGVYAVEARSRGEVTAGGPS
jgi:low temperature requirement protein LtrA